jgi:cystathionine gamma-lyase
VGLRRGGFCTRPDSIGKEKTRKRRFLENTHLFSLAESLGGVESLINHPALMTHGSIPPDTCAGLGITDSLVRLSVGVEDVADLIDDLRTGFAAI